MQNSVRTQGAALMVSLLMVMLVLASIMAVTAQITLSARRSSVDQQELLRARYAAESGVARIQAQLTTVSDLLNRSVLDPTVLNSTIETQMAGVCGVSTLPVYLSSQQLCQFVTSQKGQYTSGFTPGRIALLVNAVPQRVFQSLGIPAADPLLRTQFWADMFSGDQGKLYTSAQTGEAQEGSYSARFGLRFVRVERVMENAYRVYFKVPDLQVQGSAGETVQTMQVRADSPEYFMLVSRLPFSRYQLFVNHQFSSAADEVAGKRIVSGTDLMFSGPVHTNQNFQFSGAPWFGGGVSSAGCPQNGIGLVGGLAGCTVTPTYGAFFGATNPQFVTQTELGSNKAPVVCPGLDDAAACAADPARNAPTFGDGATWNDNFVQLPTGTTEQQLAAAASGILLAGNVSELQLGQVTVGGAAMQRVAYTLNGVTTQLAYGPDNRLMILDANQVWQPARRVPSFSRVTGTVSISFAPNRGGASALFNGVIAVRGDVQNLNGGPGANATAPAPSVAEYAALTVAATGTVAITSNLTYASPPCSGEHTRGAGGTVTPASCPNLASKNLLGIVSSGGDIELVSPASCPSGAGTCAALPADASIHAVLMASTGAVRVRGFDQKLGAPFALGDIHLLGGLIENYYGAFGSADGGGYGRNLVYDPRMNEDVAPPAFPVQRVWTVGLRTTQTVNGQSVSVNVERLRLRGDVVSTDSAATLVGSGP
jgi:Tfp pilus assembly protein PilX